MPSWSQGHVRCVLFACVALWSCGPVLLVADADQGGDSRVMDNVMRPTNGPSKPVVRNWDAGAEAADSSPNASQPAGQLDVSLSVKSLDCGACFELSVSANGGSPPYRFEWEDSSNADSRLICVGSKIVVVSVVAQDSSFVRSPVRVASLQADPDTVAACSSSIPPSSQLCLMNPSFEGTAALNTGQVFDAPPWSACVDALGDGMTNTPEIASNTLDPLSGIAPPPSQGNTYLALAVDEQASQTLCAALPAQSRSSVLLDAMRFDLAGPNLFLEIWGGTSSSCSRNELLWTSPPLSTSWVTYCATLAPNAAIDQITLRSSASTGVMPITTNYLAVDHLVPVSDCP